MPEVKPERKPGKYATHFDPKNNPRDRSLTQQQFEKDQNINNIMKKYHKTGVVPQIVDVQPQFGNFADGEDFHSSMIKVTEAQNAFANLPSKIRNRFNNEVKLFLDFISNDKNHKEAVDLGIVQKPKQKFNSDGSPIYDEFYPEPKIDPTPAPAPDPAPAG